jgi:hypothetical protein
MTRNKGYPRRSGYARNENCFYVEPRWEVDMMLDALEAWGEPIIGEVLDPCCGIGTIVSACLNRGIPARGSDIADRGFGQVRDMFSITEPVDNIISNFPYGNRRVATDGRMLHERIEHCLGLVRRKLVLILPLTFWESRRRHAFLLRHPPAWFAPCSDRPSMPPGIMDGERDRHGAIIQPPSGGATAPYGWFGWELGFRGETRVKLLALKPSARTKPDASAPGQVGPARPRQQLNAEGATTCP